MNQINYRKWIYFTLVGLRGQSLGKYYHRFFHEYQTGIPPDTSERYLIRLFQHCEQNVPYYSKIMKKIGKSFYDDPLEYLRHFPVLTKDIIRFQFDQLKSIDLPRRKWYLNSTGGSTGEPVEFIQDRGYAAQAGAIKLLFSKLVGKEFGEREVRLWGSVRDIFSSTDNWQARMITHLENARFINSGLMTPARMRDWISILNIPKTKLLVAYVEPLYELAKFVENERLHIHPPHAILTTAGKLFPFMREKIEKVFQCPVFNRYGSREVGDIACESPDSNGLWVAPWGNYLEIVDPEGNRMPPETEGEILVTSLSNYAMPLIRCMIGDRGRLASMPNNCQRKNGQVLKEVTGRSMDLFRRKDGALINSGFFMANLYFRQWIARYQIIQKDHLTVVYKIVKVTEPPEEELKEIIAITKNVMGIDCKVFFEFVDEIPTSPSGKFRFLISEVQE